MPTPVPGDLHVNGPLTNVSVAYIQEANRFIADRVFPTVSVAKQSDLFYKYDKADWFRTDAIKRAPGAESAGTGWRVSTDSYFADVWAIHTDVDDQARANADNQFNLDRDATRLVTNQLLLRRDKQFVSTFLAASGVWDTYITGNTSASAYGSNTVKQWNNADATPINDIYYYRNYILERTGFLPNTLVLGARVWESLVNHPTIIERVKYTQAGFLTEDIVAQALGIDRIVVAYATENTANEGATATMGFVTGKTALLCYSAPAPGLMVPSAGYTFSWNGLGGANMGIRTKKFRMEETASDRIEAEMAFALKAVSTDLGVQINTVVA